jgi:hypothetical protein
MGAFAVSYLIAGPLADRVFEPLLMADGLLAGSVGHIIGTGPGRGIGLIFVLVGLLSLVVTGIGFSMPRLRHLDEELPDVTAIDDVPAVPQPDVSLGAGGDQRH